jgi:hypothetical protein
MRTFLTVLTVLFLGAAPAWAVLGQSVASAQSDKQHVRGELRSISRKGYSVEEITAPGNTVIQEYVSPAGVVFGVSWKGQLMPNLSQLLGSYFPEFQKAAQSSPHRRRGVVVNNSQVVIESGGHPRGFHGRAYVPGLLPAGISPAVIQ